MKKIIATLGVSGSGKSKWAEILAYNSKDTATYISSDNIRKELFGDANDQQQGKKVFDTLYARVVETLLLKKTPIVDATHYNEKNRLGLESVAVKNNAIIEWRYFPVTLEEAKCRNQLRERVVPDHVIERQWRGLTLPMSNNIVWHGKTNRINIGCAESFCLCDLDGTLAQRVTDRSPYDSERVFEDEPNKALLEILRSLDTPKNKLVFFSAREDTGSCGKQTLRFLTEKCGFENPTLILRGKNDHRKDSLVKFEMFMENITDKEKVLVWFDDRDQVVQMVRRQLGLLCFQVQEGNF